MGKVKTVVMGDEKAEEAARKKAEAKREQKKAEKKATKHKGDVVVSPTAEEVAKAPDAVIASAAVEIDADSGSEKTAKKTKTGGKKQETSTKYKAGSGKKYAAAASLVDKTKTYSLSEAISLVKKTSFSSFDGSVELHVNVAEKGARGTVQLPHGTGKNVRVKIADDSLIAELLKSSKVDFDILVASPDMMPKLAKVAKILGPKGLMPNPKTNTISPNPEQLVKTLSSSVQWKTQNDFPIIHAVIGKVSFENKKLEENFAVLLKSIGKDKIRSLFIKPTMGPSIKLSF